MTASPAPPRRSPPAALLAAGALVVLGAVAVAWLERNAIGERAAVSYLERLSVPARVKLSRLDAGGVAGSLALGDPAHPDLTVSHFEAEFMPFSGLGAPQVRRLSLSGARLRIGIDERGLHLGDLQRLVDALQRAPATGGPSPDVDVSHSEILAQTPFGPATVGVDASVRGGKLARADLVLPRTTLRCGPLVVRGLDATVHLSAAAPDRYAAVASLGADEATDEARTLQGVRGELRAELSYRPQAAQPFAGPLRADLRWSLASAATGDIHLDALVGEAGFAGEVGAGRELALAGAAHATGSSAALAWSGGSLAHPRLQASMARLKGGWRGGPRGGADFTLAVAAPSGQARIADERATFSALGVQAKGHAEVAGSALSLAASGALQAKGGLDRRRAARLAERLAPGEYGADLRHPLTEALTQAAVAAPSVSLRADSGNWRLRLDRPVNLTAGGGRLSLAQGAGWAALADGRLDADGLTLDLAGGGFPRATLQASDVHVSPGRSRARVALDLAGSAGPLHDARIALAGDATVGTGGAAFALARCGRVDLGEMAGDGPLPLARGVSTQLCPRGSTPLVRAANGGWRATATLRSLALAAPGADLRVADAQAGLDFEGRGNWLAGAVAIARAKVADSATPLRFLPLDVSGPLRLARQRWTGDLAVALGRTGRPLGRMTVEHDLHEGAGELSFAAPGLVFAPQGLQPAAVLPGLATLGTDVTGRADATMTLGWRGAETRGGATVRTEGLQIRTPAGVVKGARFALVFTALDPLTTLPDQRLAADRMEAVFPLTDLRASFSMGGQALDLAAASAAFQGGAVSLDPMRIPLTPDATLVGAVRVRDVQLGAMLDSLSLSQAAKLDARVSGELPFSIGPKGVAFTHGRLAAVQPGRITLRREALTSASASAPGAAPTPVFQDLALQALEDLAFTQLDATVDSRPNGRLGVVFHIKGRHDPAVGKAARIGLLDALRGRAFDKPLPLPKGTEVDLTLDSSLNLDELLASYTGLQPGSVPVHP